MVARVAGKIALVTGASSGIGAAVTRLLAEEGAHVIVSDLCDKKGEALVKEIGANASYKHLDVSQEFQWQDTMDWIAKTHGKLDILVNNAGVMGFSFAKEPQDPEHTALETWHSVHAINLDSVFLGCKHGIPLMKRQGGSIINISSRSGLVGVPTACAYASSKAAIRNHTKSVALYCASQNYDIRCNSVHPATILTPLWDEMLGDDVQKREEQICQITENIPLKCMGEPIDVAYMVLYLASDESKYVTGAEFVIDGGILCGSAAAPRGK